jgi:emfourin
MAMLQVERIGGLAGFGAGGSHLRSQGQVDMASLSAQEHEAVEALFRSDPKKTESSKMRDGFRYKISRTTPSGTETVEAAESAVPPAIAKCVKDELV